MPGCDAEVAKITGISRRFPIGELPHVTVSTRIRFDLRFSGEGMYLAAGSKRVGAPMTTLQAIMFGLTPSLVLLAVVLCRERVFFDDE